MTPARLRELADHLDAIAKRLKRTGLLIMGPDIVTQEESAQALRAAADVLDIVASEPELEGPMPDYMRAAMTSNLEDTLRAAVRATKASITERIRQRFEVKG